MKKATYTVEVDTTYRFRFSKVVEAADPEEAEACLPDYSIAASVEEEVQANGFSGFSYAVVDYEVSARSSGSGAGLEG